MAILGTDLLLYASATMPETTDDSGIPGGAIVTTTRVAFLTLSSNDSVRVRSDNAGDTSTTYTVYGRLTNGSISSEALVTNGTNWVNGSTTFTTIMKIVRSGSVPSGNMEFTDLGGGDAIIIIPPGITEVRRPFYNAFSSAGAKDYYEKVFFRNDHGSLALNNATIAEGGGTLAGKISFALEDTLNGSVVGTTNRITAPTATEIGTFDSSTKNVANSQVLGSGDAQAVWLKLSLNSQESANEGTYILTIAGSTVA